MELNLTGGSIVCKQCCLFCILENNTQSASSAKSTSLYNLSQKLYLKDLLRKAFTWPICSSVRNPRQAGKAYIIYQGLSRSAHTSSVLCCRRRVVRSAVCRRGQSCGRNALQQSRVAWALSFSPGPFPRNLPLSLSLTDWFHGFYPTRVRKSLALKILVSATD